MTDPNVGVAQFGKQVEMWLDTDVGRYMVKRAEQDIDEAIELMKKTNPHDVNLMVQAQNRVKVAESVLTWLYQAIKEGEGALELLKEEEIHE